MVFLEPRQALNSPRMSSFSPGIGIFAMIGHLYDKMIPVRAYIDDTRSVGDVN